MEGIKTEDSILCDLASKEPLNLGSRKSTSFTFGKRYKFGNSAFGFKNNSQINVTFNNADSTIREEREPNREEKKIRELLEDNIKEKIRNERINGCLTESKGDLEKANINYKKLNAEKIRLEGRIALAETMVTNQSNAIVAKDLEIKGLKLKLKNTEIELQHTTFKVFEEAEDIEEGSSSSVRFTKTMAGYSVFSTDTGARELIRMLKTSAYCQFDRKPSDFFVKKKEKGGQMTFGVLNKDMEIGDNIGCIVCKRIFNDRKSERVYKGPFGVSMDNDEQKIRCGPICGFHKNGKDVTVKPVNFYIPK